MKLREIFFGPFVFLVVLGITLLCRPAEAVFFGPYQLTAPIAVDGDTIRADVTIWPAIIVDASIRVVGVDTPELRASTACERDLAVKAKAFTDTWIQTNQPLMIGAVKPDKYSGRYDDAVVTGKDGTSLTTALIQAGIGRPYSGGARQGWCP